MPRDCEAKKDVLPIVAGEWQRNAREWVRVQLSEYQGTKTIDIRTWYSAGNGELRPGRGGLTLSVHHLPKLAQAIAAALAAAREARLVNDSEAGR